MSISELANIGEFVSGFAVVVSLIYLALQTRQNAKHTMALIHQGRAAQGAEVFAMIAANPALTETMVRAAAGDATLQDIDIMQYIFQMIAGLTNFEDQFVQHRQGLLTDDDFEITVLAMKALTVGPGFRSAWQLLEGRFTKPFQEFVEEHIASTPPIAPPALPAAWRVLAARELEKVVKGPAASASTER